MGKGQPYFAENGSFINVGGIFLLNESDRNTTFQFRRLFRASDPVPLPDVKHNHIPVNRPLNIDGVIHRSGEWSSGGQTYLRSVDFDRHVVALRRPLGGFGHFEASTNQIDTELALKEHVRLSFT